MDHNSTRKISKNSDEEDGSTKNLKLNIANAPHELIPQEDKEKINSLSTRIVNVVYNTIHS